MSAQLVRFTKSHLGSLHVGSLLSLLDCDGAETLDHCSTFVDHLTQKVVSGYRIW